MHGSGAPLNGGARRRAEAQDRPEKGREIGRERDLPESKFESNLKLIFLTLRDESVDVEAVKAILKARLKQRAEEWINGQTADVLVPQIVKEIVEVVKLVLQERVRQRIEQAVDVPLRQIKGEVVGVMKEKRCVSQDETQRMAQGGEKYREEDEAKLEAEV